MECFYFHCLCSVVFIVCFPLQELQAAELNSGSGSGLIGSGELLPPVFEPPVKTYGNLTCESFYTDASSCYPLMHYFPSVITNNSRSNQVVASNYVEFIVGTLYRFQPSPLCIQAAVPLLCRFSFPTCDPSYVLPTYQPICQWDCRMIRDFLCREPWRIMEQFSASINLGVLDRFDCELLKEADGGNSPMCISTYTEGEIPLPLQTGSVCYTGRGRGYNGTVDVTESGFECQPWTQTYPHQHLLHYQTYFEIQGGHNFCRNPGGRGERPWCFTTNRTQRWEYCNIPKCAPGPVCEQYRGDTCYGRGQIGLDHIYINTSIATQPEYEEEMKDFFITAASFSPKCHDIFLDFMCISTFSSCDLSHSQPRPHQVCRSYCESVMELCQDDLENLLNFNKLLDISPLVLPDCTRLPDPNGGDSPECYIPITSPNTTIGFSKCYDPTDNGITYNGTVNTTSSGKHCVAWDSTQPHTHPLNSIFRSALTGHNYCRNPERRGRKPWCYTTDPATRWEYCDIPECTPTTATSSPTTTTSSPTSYLDYIVIAAPSAGGGLILLLLILISCICIMRRNLKRTTKKIELGDNNNNLRYTNVKMLEINKTIHCEDEMNPLYTKSPHAMQGSAPLEYEGSLKELSRDDIIYIRDLGQGRFGLVVQAEIKSSNEVDHTVAIKVLKDGVTPEIRAEFFREATLMNSFDHPNIVRLLGVCIEQDPLCMVFEFMELGDLNNYLRQNTSNAQNQLGAPLTAQQLVGMAVDVAAGLHYLSQNHFVHRDLATRNCLINSKFRVKISDFGLSQDVYTKDYFRLGDSELLPIRWMPPEAILYAKFTLQSDVWSFGVVLWEIFTFGMQPYFTLTNEEVVQHIRSGNVLNCPNICPEDIYDLMMDCWAMNPDQRPTAGELHRALQRWNPRVSESLRVSSGDAEAQQQYQNVSTVLEYAEHGITERGEEMKGVNDDDSKDKEAIESRSAFQNGGVAYEHLDSPSETRAPPQSTSDTGSSFDVQTSKPLASVPVHNQRVIEIPVSTRKDFPTLPPPPPPSLTEES